MSTAHWFGPGHPSHPGNGHPVMFGDPAPAVHFDPMPDGGGYPKGFLEWAFKKMGADPAKTLHLCSGSVRTGVRVDVRRAMCPSVNADCARLPFADESFDWILADPPYSEDYAENLYDTRGAYPSPGSICREAARVLRPGGQVGLMHFQVPMVRRPLAIEGVYGITTGSGYAIRAWTLLRKEQARLF